MNKTIFLDIDGCLIKHHGNVIAQILTPVEVLPGTVEKIIEWSEKEYMIILTTGRKECLREITEKQLISAGIIYDQLIMGVTRGERIIINDSKPNSNIKTVSAIQIIRNKGIADINLE